MHTPSIVLIALALVSTPTMARARMNDQGLLQRSPKTIWQESEKQVKRCTTCTPQKQTSETVTSLYENTEFHFSLQIPKGWSMHKDDHSMQNATRIAYFLPPKTSAENQDLIGIVVENPAPKNVETYLVNAVWWLKETIPSLGELSAEASMIDGQKAFALSFIGSQGEEKKFSAKEYFVLHDGRTIIIGLWTSPDRFATYEKTLDAMVSTMTLQQP